ncbi:hypothetical protein [Microbacterium sp.]
MTKRHEFAGMLEGWSWQEQAWTGADWADVEEITTTSDPRLCPPDGAVP